MLVSNKTLSGGLGLKESNAILDIVKTDISHNFTFIDDGFSQMNPQNIFLYLLYVFPGKYKISNLSAFSRRIAPFVISTFKRSIAYGGRPH